MFAFILAVLLLLATPGPGVLSTAGVGAAFGFRGFHALILIILNRNLIRPDLTRGSLISLP